MNVGDRLTILEFRRRHPEYDEEFAFLSDNGYDFEWHETVEVVEQGRENGGHLRLRGNDFAIQFSQGEPIVTDITGEELE